VHVNKTHAVKYIKVTKTTTQNYEQGKFTKFGPLLYMQPSDTNYVTMYSFSQGSFLPFVNTGQ